MSFTFKYNYPQVARDAGFQLRNYKDGPLDWRLMGSVEVERILREQRLEQVDSILEHLSEAPLGSMLETNILDGAIAKYFLLSQFSIQYLLFCRKFLEETVVDLRESHVSSQIEIATLNRSLSEANNEILQLHKKITQMEAIHEIIYPCHLCTKNFVSNDALNLHISRKHNATNTKQEDGMETQATSVKERENDLTLINTIKLELEIKHLKERLNNAERKIKENDAIPTTSRSDFENQRNYSGHSVSVGIQSNLSEVKEHDEQSEYECKYCSENKCQISTLKDRLQNLYDWKEEQRIQNTAFLAEIDGKFKDIIQNQQQQQQNAHSHENIPLPTSVEDLDTILNKTVEDIGKTTAAKLDAAVSKIETSYTRKLESLEKELIKITRQSKNSNIPIPQKKLSGQTKNLISHNEKSDTEIVDSPQKTITHTNNIVAAEENSEVIERPPSEKSNSLSNPTFIKTKADNNIESDSEVEDKHNIAELYTDVSDEIQEDEDLTPQEIIHKNMKSEEKSVVRPPPNQKAVTRKEAKKLVNSRLSDLGVNMKTKSLPHASMKHISNELNERRIKLKEKHSNFYATRNKIKKFVDKICSSKMPENAQLLLERPIKQKEAAAQSYSSSSDERFRTSRTQLQATAISKHDTDFKQRLESILSSPIRKPDDNQNKPIPMPRKRVMFNHQPDMKSSETLSESESEEVKHHTQKAHIHQHPLENSMGNIL